MQCTDVVEEARAEGLNKLQQGGSIVLPTIVTRGGWGLDPGRAFTFVVTF